MSALLYIEIHGNSSSFYITLFTRFQPFIVISFCFLSSFLYYFIPISHFFYLTTFGFRQSDLFIHLVSFFLFIRLYYTLVFIFIDISLL